ncbi:MAG: type II secretion system protein GspK [Methylococcaceae bacterium]|nr:type II secretion system protein GspK [Methylococcaceae bacterium]MDZ4156591.1 type II secretion system protein GspK [Methylococcales bacterium]MDP2394741.1 type II secretion system protein GspK [Methylococcaceae bacterium]MDP3020163.1 type II secretion system protein GspK [Methylococcaceae bacterium]MDP3390703.1 type II secretion system protein GspK [Methylococcaceae bacterium]
MNVTKQQGFALILVLWVLSLLIIMAGSFALNMRRETAVAAGVKANAQAMALAESGVAVAELMLLHPEVNKRWRADGSVYEIDFTDAQVRIQMLAEVGKIDINNASEELLQALINHVVDDEGRQTKLVNAILDWRDADDLARPDGAEKNEYKKAGLNYQPRNKRFRAIEELQLVQGISEDVYQALVPVITSYSGKDVDLQQASRAVLEIIPTLNAKYIDQYLAARFNSAVNGLPSPSTALLTAGELNADDLNLTPSESSATELSEQAPVSAGVTEIIAEVHLQDGASATLSVVVEKTEGVGTNPFKVIKWRSNQHLEQSLFFDDENNLLVKQYAEPEFNN